MSNVFAPSIIAEAVAASTISAGKVTADGPGFSVVEDALVNLDNEVESGGNVVAMTNTRESGDKFGQMLGGASNLFTTPSSAAMDVTTDFEIVCKAKADKWDIASGFDTIFSRYDYSATKRTWAFSRDTGGTISLQISDDGTVADVLVSDALALVDGQTYWLRVVFSSGTANFYYSADSTSDSRSVSWTSVGTDTSTITTVWASGSNMAIGGRNAASPDQLFSGSVFNAELYNGIDPLTQTLAVDFNPNDYANTGNTNWASSATGEVWTIQGNNYVVTPRALVGTGAPWGDLPGSAGDYFSTPDSVANSVTGDIDIRVKVAMDDWTPAASQILVSKLSASSQYSYDFYVLNTGVLGLLTSAGGTTFTQPQSTVATGIADGVASWVRATRVASTGVVKFYTSSNGETWTQLGADVADTPNAIFDSTSEVRIGLDTGNPLAGKVHRAQILKGIDGPVVVDFDPIMHTNGTTFYGRTGETWTANGNAAIHGYDVNTVVGTGANLRKSVSGAALLYGASGDYIATPDSVAASITGDIDIRVKVALDDWTPAANGILCSKYVETGNQRSFIVQVLATSGLVTFIWSQSGSANLSVTSTVAPTVIDGAALWIRVSVDSDDGAGGADVTFYTSTDGSIWTQLGDVVHYAGTIIIFDSTSAIEVGSAASGVLNRLAGKVYSAQIYDGIDGTLAADFNATDAGNTGATSFDTVLGSDLVTNGDFATSSDWTLASGCSITGGQGVMTNQTTGAGFQQNIGSVAGNTYRVTYDVISIAGFISPQLGGVTPASDNTVGAKTHYITTLSGGNFYIISRQSGTDCVIDNVKVELVNQWTLNGNTFIQNTGHDVVHSVGSAGLESTAGITIASPGTVFAVARFSDSAPATDENLFSSRSSTTERWAIYSRQLGGNKFSIFQDGSPVSLTENYDVLPHVFTGQFNGDATTKLTVSNSGQALGNAGADNWDYGSLLITNVGTAGMQGYIGQLIVFDRALSETEIQAVQGYLQSKYAV